MKNNTEKRMVYLVGAGPGDPDLLTIRGLNCLKQADVVIYDYLASPELLSNARCDAELIYVGKKAGNHTLSQEKINQLIVDKAGQGCTVVRLKGGDPFVFGRGGEECQALSEAGIPFEVVPGITAAIGSSCYAGIPVTHRNIASSVAFVTGHEDPSKNESSINWQGLAAGVDTIVFYMGISTLQFNVKKLIEYGRPEKTPAAVIQWGTTGRQKTVTGTLATIYQRVLEAKITAPAITIVGEVVELAPVLNWFEKRPLFGKKIITTRTAKQAGTLSSRLRDMGADVIEMPTIEIKPVDETSELDMLLQKKLSYDWLIFTSPNAANIFFEKLLKYQGDIRSVGDVLIACIGPSTADTVRSFHLGPSVVPVNAVAEGLLAELEKKGSWVQKRVCIPRAREARDILPETLRQWGAMVDVITTYHTLAPEHQEKGVITDIAENRYDLITFTSSSTFLNFIRSIGPAVFEKIKPYCKAASIGPVTTATLLDHGVTPVVQAKEHTINGLLTAIQEYYKE